MNRTLKQFKDQARDLLRQMPNPKFYEDMRTELEFAHKVFFDNPLILRLREDVLPFLYDDYGHGVEHAKKVAIEAAAIVLAEKGEDDMQMARHMALLAQMAGLMHDVCRLDSEHAARGAELSETILHQYPLEDEEKRIIAFAIANHEAFNKPAQAPDLRFELVSNALYDADKFRWGPDNFSTTLWEICDYEEWTLQEILERFPYGVGKIREISGTFRTEVGRLYGPDFIQLGLDVAPKIESRLADVCASVAPSEMSK